MSLTPLFAALAKSAWRVAPGLRPGRQNWNVQAAGHSRNRPLPGFILQQFVWTPFAAIWL